MEKNKWINIDLFSGILMILYPIIWNFLFFDQAREDWISIYSITIIYLYLTLYAGLLVILGVIIIRMDYNYNYFKVDWTKLGKFTIRIGVVLGFIGLIIFIILGIIKIILSDNSGIISIFIFCASF